MPCTRRTVQCARLLIGVACTISMVVGACWVMYFPRLLRGQYLSENALIPGSAHVGFGADEAEDSVRFAQDYARMLSGRGADPVAWLLGTLRSFGDTEAYFHTPVCGSPEDTAAAAASVRALQAERANG